MKRDWFPILFNTALVLIVVAIAAFATVGMPALECSMHSSNTGLQTKWTYFSGCLVAEKDGTWIPYEKMRGGK